MKIIATTLLFMLSVIGFAQQNEFPVFSNGLIYDPATMSRLEVIVDSLNLKFRSCDLAHPYYAYTQGKAWTISLKQKIAEARQAIDDGISLEDFKKSYPDA